jgi:hypothetical protein
MNLFSNPLRDALRQLDADPKLWGWPIWSRDTGRHYVIVPEEKYRELADLAGFEIKVAA